MPNRSKLLAAGLLLLTFVGGAAVGVAGSTAWRGQHDDRPPRGRESRASFTDRLTRELALSPVQQESVRAVLDRGQRGMREIWREAEPRFDSLRHRLDEEILAQLDSTQRTKFRALVARSDSMRAAREKREKETRDQHDRQR